MRTLKKIKSPSTSRYSQKRNTRTKTVQSPMNEPHFRTILKTQILALKYRAGIHARRMIFFE